MRFLGDVKNHRDGKTRQDKRFIDGMPCSWHVVPPGSYKTAK
jgi:hypothetical protein